MHGVHEKGPEGLAKGASSPVIISELSVEPCDLLCGILVDIHSPLSKPSEGPCCAACRGCRRRGRRRRPRHGTCTRATRGWRPTCRCAPCQNDTTPSARHQAPRTANSPLAQLLIVKLTSAPRTAVNRCSIALKQPLLLDLQYVRLAVPRSRIACPHHLQS